MPEIDFVSDLKEVDTDLFLSFLFFSVLFLLVFCPAFTVDLMRLMDCHKGFLIGLIDYIYKLRVFVH